MNFFFPILAHAAAGLRTRNRSVCVQNTSVDLVDDEIGATLQKGCYQRGMSAPFVYEADEMPAFPPQPACEAQTRCEQTV